MVRAVAAMVVLVPLGGCDLVFPPADGTPDGGAHVTVRLHVYSAKNDANGALKVAMEDATPTADSTAVRLRDGATSAVAIDDASRSFGFDVPAPGTPYSIITSIGGDTLEIQHDAAELDYVIRTAGRAPTPIAKDPLTALTMVSATGATRLYVSGTQESVVGNNPGVGQAFAWLDKVLVKSSLGDRVFAVGFEQLATPRYVRIDAMAGPMSIELADGTQQSLNAPFDGVTSGLCANIDSARTAEDSRVRSQAGLVGTGWQRDEATWAIQTGPAPDVVGPIGLFDLAGDRIDAGSPLEDLPASTIEYSNPSLGGTAAIPQLAAQLVFATRPVQLNTSSAPVQLRGGTAQYAALPSTTGGSCASASFGPGLAFPHGIALAGATIEQDDAKVVRSAVGDQLLSWTVDSLAPDYYVVVLRQLHNKADGAATLSAIRTYATNRTEVAISHDLLEKGHYVFDIIGLSGYPNAKTGDFRTLSYPAQIVHAFSGVFEITQ